MAQPAGEEWSKSAFNFLKSFWSGIGSSQQTPSPSPPPPQQSPATKQKPPPPLQPTTLPTPTPSLTPSPDHQPSTPPQTTISSSPTTSSSTTTASSSPPKIIQQNQQPKEVDSQEQQHESPIESVPPQEEKLEPREVLETSPEEAEEEVRVQEERCHLPIFQFYAVGEVLGKGAFSEVKLAIDNVTKQKWAVKVIAKKAATEEEARLQSILAEIAILKAVRHKNIVQLRETFESADYYYIVMENISGGELFDRIVALSSYSENDASRIIKQILEGLRHLHLHNIAHRDLKPENLLLSSSSPDADIKITDFGLSEISPELPPDSEMKMTKPVGTPGYLAPEILDLLDTGKPYGKEVDLWSVGVIMYILLCGFPPFYGEDDDEMYDKIQVGEYDFPSPHWDHITPSAVDLIKKLMELDPKKRFTASQALQHSWIVNQNLMGSSDLQSTLVNLRKFNAKRKFRGAIKALITINRLQKGFLARIKK